MPEEDFLDPALLLLHLLQPLVRPLVRYHYLSVIYLLLIIVLRGLAVIILFLAMNVTEGFYISYVSKEII